MQRSQCCRILMARSVAGQGATAAVQWREGLMRDRCRVRGAAAAAAAAVAHPQFAHARPKIGFHRPRPPAP